VTKTQIIKISILNNSVITAHSFLTTHAITCDVNNRSTATDSTVSSATGSLGWSHQNVLQNLPLLPVFYFEISFTSPPALLLLWLWISAWLPKDLAETSAICHNISAGLRKYLVETSAKYHNISAWLRKDLVETSAVCHNISHSYLLNITHNRPVAPV
jgi:hypothetical protein